MSERGGRVLEDGRALLERTPAVLDALVGDLPRALLHGDEGPDTWSPRDVLAHMVDAEDALWVPRLETILEHGEDRTFPPFDRVRFRERFQGEEAGRLLELFAAKRRRSLARLDELSDGTLDLSAAGKHPEFGRVEAGQLLATWVVHDQTHIRQIARVLATQYREAVGPWKAYLTVFEDRVPDG